MVELDIREKGGPRGGERQVLDTRLFMQLQVFTGCKNTEELAKSVAASGLEGVLYEDINDPTGVGFLTWDADPEHFVGPVRRLLTAPPFAALTFRSNMTMLGRTYALGHEPNLEDWLLHKPRRNATNPDNRWAIWYPLRRTGQFSALPPEEQGPIMAEHGKIGHAFGEAGLAADIRLACFGIDQNDNDFVIGLVGSELHPLSACVQAMRRTQQTSRYIQTLGPFFIGRVRWQSPRP